MHHRPWVHCLLHVPAAGYQRDKTKRAHWVTVPASWRTKEKEKENKVRVPRASYSPDPSLRTRAQSHLWCLFIALAPPWRGSGQQGPLGAHDVEADRTTALSCKFQGYCCTTDHWLCRSCTAALGDGIGLSHCSPRLCSRMIPPLQIGRANV